MENIVLGLVKKRSVMSESCLAEEQNSFISSFMNSSLASLALKNTSPCLSGFKDEKFEAFHVDSSHLTEN